MLGGLSEYVGEFCAKVWGHDNVIDLKQSLRLKKMLRAWNTPVYICPICWVAKASAHFLVVVSLSPAYGNDSRKKTWTQDGRLWYTGRVQEKISVFSRWRRCQRLWCFSNFVPLRSSWYRWRRPLEPSQRCTKSHIKSRIENSNMKGLWRVTTDLDVLQRRRNAFFSLLPKRIVRRTKLERVRT